MRRTIARWFNRRTVSVIGVTRFSALIDENHPFRDADDPLDVRAARLFDEARLRRRFAIWEAVTLPSLAAQSDGEFSLIVVTSSMLPGWARQRLETILAAQPYPTHILAPGPDEVFNKVIRQGVRAAADPVHGQIGTFRLDDDDALAADWVARFRAGIAEDRTAVPVPQVYGFSTGWFLAPEGEGVRLAPVTRKLIACGLARNSPRTPLRTIHDPKIAHHKLDEVLPTREMGGAPAWIVTAHGLNDSGRREHDVLKAAPVLTCQAAAAMLGPNFAGLDLDRVALALRV